MESESIALHIHWNLYSEFNNEENSQSVKDFFKLIYDELMYELEDNNHPLH